MASVLITGGSGLIGRHLTSMLMGRGYEVMLLSRRRTRESEVPMYVWDWENGKIEVGAIENADYIIHLSGANIGDQRWTKKRKQMIIDSRVKSAELLFEKVKSGGCKPKAFISASAIGYYGASSHDKIYTESDPPANDFLGFTCSQWEKAADRFNVMGSRVVKIRTGVVLTKEGGVLEKMTFPVKMGIGSALGTGKQYLPWIHIDDLCAIYLKALEDNQMSGAYNAVAPDHKTNTEFTRMLAEVLRKPLFFPKVPSVIIKLLFGEMSVTVLKGSRISAEKIIGTGYEFRFTDLNMALEDLFLC